MKKIERIVSLMGLSALLLLGACDATTADPVDGSDTTSDTSGGGDTSPGVVKYESAIIYDNYIEPDCATTSSPGPDIDAIGLYRLGKLVGVARKGSAQFAAGSKPQCPGKEDHKTASDVEGALNADESNGYLGLRGGSVEFQFGACAVSTASMKDCDGSGAIVQAQVGDEIDVYEVDQSYKVGGKGPQAGRITKECKCLPEKYDVFVRKTKNVDAGAVNLGSYTGTTGSILVK